jgi:hypothetical protein
MFAWAIFEVYAFSIAVIMPQATHAAKMFLLCRKSNIIINQVVYFFEVGVKIRHAWLPPQLPLIPIAQPLHKGKLYFSFPRPR